jgi:hypothetical protein
MHKIKGALGIGGLTDDNVEKVEQYVSGKQDLEQTQADYEEGRPKTKSDFIADPTESNDQQLTVKDILTPPIGMLARIRRTLAFGLGLTDKSGQSFLLKISEALEGKDPSATEGANVKPDDDAGIPSLKGDGDEKGGIMGFLSGLMGAAGAALAGGITALSAAIRGLAMSVMMLANPAAFIIACSADGTPILLNPSNVVIVELYTCNVISAICLFISSISFTDIA